MSCAVSVPMPITADALSIAMLLEGINQLGLAIKQIQEIRDKAGHACKVDFVIQNKEGDKIGVVKSQEGQVNFVLADAEKESVKSTINQVKQVYARLKVLQQVKSKGYQQVKEEKLADGTIRLVVQKWR